MNFDFKNDRSWFVIIALIVVAGPVGFIALIAKIAYMIYKSSQLPDEPPKYETYTRTSKSSEYSTVSSTSTYGTSSYEEDFNSYGNTTASATSDTYDATGSQSSFYQAAENIGVDLPTPDDVILEVTEGDDDERPELADMNMDESLDVPDIDFDVPDISVDISIDEPKADPGSGEPLKVLTCTMCGTENKIYEINVFETPTCEKCGMLLLDRS